MAIPGMDQPPLPSPDIQSQMGVAQPPPPGQGLSQLQPSAGGKPAPGAPNPHGFLMSQIDAIKKLLEQMAQAEPVFAPFAQKMIQVGETGVSAVSTAPQGQPGAGPGVESGTQGPPPPLPGGAGGPTLG
jgi:hypothetical protein